MTITRHEHLDFLAAYLNLLYFVGQRGNIISSDTDFADFTELDIQIRVKCRAAFNKNAGLLDEYLKPRVDTLLVDQVKILDGFKRKIEHDLKILTRKN